MVEIISTILHPMSTSLSLSLWLISVDSLHSYDDAQSSDNSSVLSFRISFCDLKFYAHVLILGL
jgi:hypothetical protein